MRTLLLFLSIAACTGAPPHLPDGPLDQPGGVPVIDLRRTTAAWTLPSTPAAVTKASFTLGPPRPTGASGQRPQWRYDLPFDPGPDSERFAPAGMVVRADGAALPWLQNVVQRDGWRIVDGDLVILAERPASGVVVEHPRLVEIETRLSPADSGLPPSEFVTFDLTIGPDHREGLLVPAGGRGRWTVDLPVGARLEAAVAPVPSQAGAPASLVVTVDRGDGAVEVASTSPSGDGYSPWVVDLSPYAGPSVTVGVEGRGPDGSLAFVAHPQIRGTEAQVAPRRVVWIGLDTTRRDKMGFYGSTLGLTPALDRWTQGALIADDAIAPAPRTRPSFRTALTGRRPLDAVAAPTILERLDRAGFVTAGIVANVHLNERFGFTRGTDRWWLDPQARAEGQVERAWSWLSEHRDQDSALFLHFMDAHTPYNPPPGARARWVTVTDPTLPAAITRTTLARWTRTGALSDSHKRYAEDLYNAEIAALDATLGPFLRRLDTLPGPTLVVLHSDHGEEFWDHGGFDHNHTLKPELVDAIVALRIPGQEPERLGAPVGLVDLAPTVAALAGLPDVPTDGQSLLAPIPQDRALDVAHLMYDTERWAVRTAERTYVLWTGSGEDAAFDRQADPTEDTPITLTTAERQTLQAELARLHGADVGPGWRARVELGTEVVTWKLPAPALSAGVLDPEVFSEHRANQVWGEAPPVRPDQVARVTLSDDGRELRIEPGPIGKGTLWIRFERPIGPGGLIESGDRSAPVRGGPQGGAPGLAALDVRDGTVIVPPPGEAARLLALTGRLEGVDPATAEVLRRLGYLQSSGSPAP